MKRAGGTTHIFKLLGAAFVVFVLVATATFVSPQQAVADFDGVIEINKSVTGPVPPTTFSFEVAPEVEGCTATQTVTLDETGGQILVRVKVEVPGTQNLKVAALDWDSPITPVFNQVNDFLFRLQLDDPDLLQPGGVYVDPALNFISYTVDGSLPSPTPSGFAAFLLSRRISGPEFYAQGSSLTLRISSTADLSDGLHASDLDDSAGPGLILNAREVDTGRYHPPLFELNSDGSSQIQNSNNSGGVNPQTGEVVDVDFGDEYIATMSAIASPPALWIAGSTDCTYTVTELPSAVASPLFDSYTGISPLIPSSSKVVFDNVSTAPLTCYGREVTIDISNAPTDVAPENPLLDIPVRERPEAVIIGTPGDDVILGTNSRDLIEGRGGDDYICGGGGDDRIYGGDGGDWIITTGSGTNQLFGGLGIDRIFGSGGDDYIEGGGGSDAIYGRPGNDVIFAGSGADRVFAGDGDDEIYGQGGQDSLYGEDGDDTIQGTWQSDRIWGGEGDDTLRGAAGKDKIFGGPGNDLLFGGVNSDWLDGEAGTDAADGQAGREYPFEEGVTGCVAETITNC